MTIQIQTPSPGAVLAESFKLQGRVRPELEEFIIPTVLIGDQSHSMAPVRVRHATARISENSVAGERPIMRFESIGGVFCVIRKLQIRSGAGAAPMSVLFPGNSTVIGVLPTVSEKTYTDGRFLAGTPFGAPQQPSGVLTTGTQPGAIAGGQWETFVPADGLLVEPEGWIIGTGREGLVGFMEVQIALNNTQILGSLEWDEYAVI